MSHDDGRRLDERKLAGDDVPRAGFGGRCGAPRPSIAGQRDQEQA